MPAEIRRLWYWLGLLTLLLLAWFVYRPGLSGGFLFDDFVNLDTLGNSGPVDNWRTFWRFITSGSADPTGRPLALLSFLIDARDWPAAPAPFLRTNVLLHLINGALLFSLLRRLGSAIDPRDVGNDAAALLATGLWLLHPLFVSTTLYIVQREAMLPATFVLLGLLAFTHGRLRFGQTDGAFGMGWMLAGILLGTLLALLCKSNGILLPLLAWVLEATVFRAGLATSLSSTAQRKLRRMTGLLLVLPSMLVFAYLAARLPQLMTPLSGRAWTIGQRLLTEPRVMVDYLNLLLVPRSVSTGLYNDGYPVSQSLWNPASTLLAWFLVSGLVGLGFHLRRRSPAFSAAILFFFAGHLLESTTIPLELYFEHRNYLPALLLFWPLARALCRWQIASTSRMAIAIALLALLALTTYQRAELWGQPRVLAALWAKQNPGSSRAQAVAAMEDTNAGNPEQAMRRLAPLWRQRPDDLQIALNYIDAACAWHGLSAIDHAALARTLRQAANAQQLTSRWLGKAIDVAASGQCPGMNLVNVESWIDAALHNPTANENIRNRNMEPLLARIALRKHQPDLALLHFNHALAVSVTPDAAAGQAGMLASSGYYEQALAHLDTYERLKSNVRTPGLDMSWLHARVLDWQGYWPYEMAVLRGKLHAAIADRANESPKRN